MVMLNKSYRGSSRGNQQNLVCIFQIFLRFSRNFLSFSQNHLLFKNHFCRQVPGISFLLKTGPQFMNKPLERWNGSQCGPWPWPTAVPAKIRRAGGADGQGEGGEVHGAHLGFDLRRI
jgi:hypothetical protein